MLKKWSLIIALLICSISYAQRPESSVDIVFGPTISNIVDEDLDKTNFIVGINGGVSLNVPVSINGVFSTGVLYNQKGFKQNGISLKLDYLTIPVHFAIESSSRFYSYFGPEFNYLLSSEISNGKQSEKFDDEVNKIDIAFAVGMKAYINQKLSISVGATIGVLKVIKVEGYKDSHIGNNISIPITLGVEI